jgi:hypothetical protein
MFTIVAYQGVGKGLVFLCFLLLITIFVAEFFTD